MTQTPGGYDVAQHLEQDEVPAATLDAVIAHLDDAPIPEEKPLLEQLAENVKISLTGSPIPTGIKITGHVEF